MEATPPEKEGLRRMKTGQTAKSILVAFLRTGEASIERIAHETRISPEVIRSSVSRLVVAGLLEKKENKNAPRTFSLTESGRVKATALSQMRQKAEVKESAASMEISEFPRFEGSGFPSEVESVLGELHTCYGVQLAAFQSLRDDIDWLEGETKQLRSHCVDLPAFVEFDVKKLAGALMVFPGMPLATPRMSVDELLNDSAVPEEAVLAIVRATRAFTSLHAAIRACERKKAALAVVRAVLRGMTPALPTVATDERAGDDAVEGQAGLSTEHLAALAHWQQLPACSLLMAEGGVVLTPTEVRDLVVK